MYCAANWKLLKILESKLDGNYTWMLSATLKISWKQQRNKSQFDRHITDFFLQSYANAKCTQYDTAGEQNKKLRLIYSTGNLAME